MTDHTAETLRLWRSVPFSYTTGNDCLMSLAEHVRRATGRDYGAIWRGTYETEAQAFAHVETWGGAENMVDASKLARTTEPQRGDIVLIDWQGKQIGGIFTGNSVAMRLPRGMVDINSRLVRITAAWRVE